MPSDTRHLRFGGGVIRRGLFAAGGGSALLTVLAACAPVPVGTAAPPAPGKATGSLRFMFRAGAEAVGFEAITKMFRERYPSITVTTEPSASGHEDKMLVQVASGTEADLTWCASIGNFYDFISLHAWLPLDSYVKRDKLELGQWYPAAERMLVVDGTRWALPLWSHPSITGFYYNRDIFDKDGVKYPDENWTVQQLEEAAQKLTKRSPTGDVKDNQWGFRPLTGFYNGLAQIILQQGGAFVSKDGKKATFESDAATRGAVEWLRDQFHRTRVGPVPEYSWGGSSAAKVPPQTLAMWADGYWGWYASNTWQFKWGVTQLPKGKAGTNGAMLQTDAIPISKRSKAPDAAWELHKFHSTQEAGLTFNENKIIPGSRPDVWTHPKVVENEAQRSWSKSLQTASPLIYPDNFQVLEWNRFLTETSFPIWKGDLGVDQGIQQLQAAAGVVLARPRARL